MFVFSSLVLIFARTVSTQFGSEGDYNVMVMDLRGPSLEDLVNICNRKQNLKTVLMFADQMWYRIEYLHSNIVVHR